MGTFKAMFSVQKKQLIYVCLMQSHNGYFTVEKQVLYGVVYNF